jgi:hypothetical protein
MLQRFESGGFPISDISDHHNKVQVIRKKKLKPPVEHESLVAA